MNEIRSTGQNVRSFRELPQRQQFQVFEDLFDKAKQRQDPTGGMGELANNLGLDPDFGVAQLEIGILIAGRDMNQPGAGDGVSELAEALGLSENKIDEALGQYAAETAKNTNPHGSSSGGSLT